MSDEKINGYSADQLFTMWPRQFSLLKFVFSKKATKIDEIFTVNLTVCSKCQIDGGDFVNFYGLLGKHEL